MTETSKEIWHLDKEPLSTAEVEEGLGFLKDKGTKDAKAYDTKPLSPDSLKTRRLDDNPGKYVTRELKKSVAEMAAEDVEPVEDWQIFARNLKLSSEFAEIQKRIDQAETFEDFKEIIKELPRNVQTRVVKDYAEWINEKQKNSQ